MMTQGRFRDPNPSTDLMTLGPETPFGVYQLIANMIINDIESQNKQSFMN